MKVVLLSRTPIKSKKNNAEYVKYNALDVQGNSVDVFITREQDEAFGLPVDSVVKPEVIKEVFAQLPQVDVEFGQYGRIQSIKKAR